MDPLRIYTRALRPVDFTVPVCGGVPLPEGALHAKAPLQLHNAQGRA